MQLYLNHSFLAYIFIFLIAALSSCENDFKEASVIDSYGENQIVSSEVDFEKTEKIVPQNACSYIRLQVQSMEFQKKLYELYGLDHMFLPGGDIKGYYQNDTLVIVKTYYSGELGGIGKDYYLEDQEIIALHQYSDNYRQIDQGHWDYRDKTRMVDRTVYFYQGDSICSEVITEHESYKTDRNGLQLVTLALKDFERIKNELDSDRLKLK